ncbi:MAG: hypothetical protein JWQ07_411 [Ramlibacter sp.]|nr:hypothetical protein [Ramlibacter sp.]
MKRRQVLCAGGSALVLASVAALPGCGGGGGGGAPMGPGVEPVPPDLPPAPAVDGPPWWGFGRDAQHSAVSAIAAQALNRISWSAPVDLAPQYETSGNLLIHYGSPAISARNTVIFGVKTGATAGFRIEGRSGGNGGIIWSQDTDYRLPPHNWVPSYNVVLTPAGRLYAPAAGGRLLVRDNADTSASNLQTAVFYGADTYVAAPATYDATVFINTPVTSDSQGNLFFGFVVTGANPAGLASGIARLDANGTGRWVSAAAAAANPLIAKPATNAAPALSPDMRTVYVAVNTPRIADSLQTGYLLALDSTTLAVKGKVALADPSTGRLARVNDDSTASPAVAADGRVFFGVLESTFGEHNGRGWLLQFDPLLAAAQLPGAFGWDVTPSVIPAAMVPTYVGTSSYLIAVKYNNYDGLGTGDGRNRLAVLDPGASQIDPISGRPVMREVLTILGPTLESPTTSGVREWCINTMAADPLTRSILANSEDGLLYRWDLPSNSFTQSIRLTAGLGQAYTPTAIGADGAVYAISNARVFSVAR